MNPPSVAQAMEFYGPVREVLRTKLKEGISERAKAVLEKEFPFTLQFICIVSDNGILALNPCTKQNRPFRLKPEG